MTNAVFTIHWNESHIRTRRRAAGHREGKGAWGPLFHLLDRHMVRVKEKEGGTLRVHFSTPKVISKAVSPWKPHWIRFLV